MTTLERIPDPWQREIGGQDAAQFLPSRGIASSRETVAGRPRLSVRRASLLTFAGDVLAASAPAAWDATHIRATVSLCAVIVVLFQLGGLYRTRLRPSFLDDLPSLGGRLLAATGLIATVTALRHPVPGELRDFLNNAAIAIGLLLAARLIVTSLVSTMRRSGMWADNVVVVGGGLASIEVMDILDRWPEHGLRVAGYVDDDLDGPRLPEVSRLGSVRDLPNVVASAKATVVLIGDGSFRDEAVSELLSNPALSSHDMYVVSRLLDTHVGGGSFDHIGAIPVTRLSSPNRRLFARTVKRAIDIVVSAIGLVVASPLLVLSIVALRIESGPGTIFFRQTRIGLYGEEFRLLKLRTMKPVPEAESDRTWTVHDPKRIGPVGRLLRRMSIDELPQLWNILLGHMSLVGPRPERPVFVEKFAAQHPHYLARHRAQVGLTGLAQVSGLRGDTSIADRVRYDNYYIENWSLWLDIKILIRTAREVLGRSGG